MIKSGNGIEIRRADAEELSGKERCIKKCECYNCESRSAESCTYSDGDTGRKSACKSCDPGQYVESCLNMTPGVSRAV